MTPLVIASRFILLSALVACAHGTAEEPRASDPRIVGVASVSSARIAPPVVATGTLLRKEEVALAFKVGGVIDRVLADEGDRVRAGALLAALDLAEIDAAVARARSASEKAARDLERLQRLHADSVAPLEQVQDAKTRRDLAAAELDAAAFNRRHAVIVAPSGGVILRRDAEPGELLAPGVPVLILGSDARGAVFRAWLADRDILRVRRGDIAAVSFAAMPGRELPGRVSGIGGAADPMTGMYRVEVTLEQAGELPSGLVGRLEIRPAAPRAFSLIPIGALIEAHGDSGTVFALSSDGRRAERRVISIAFLSGDRVAVGAGLDGVARVIVDGAAYLNDGQIVKVRP